MRRHLLLAALLGLLVLLVDDTNWLEKWIRRLGYDGRPVCLVVGPFIIQEIGVGNDDMELFVQMACRPGAKVLVARDVWDKLQIYRIDHSVCLDGIDIEVADWLPDGSATAVSRNLWR